MRRIFPAEELARDERFARISNEERFNDPRGQRGIGRAGEKKRGPARLTPDLPEAPDAARSLMHGIFVGEIQALEGAGRTCWDFTTAGSRTSAGESAADETVPFALKLDMARQCWDEARHCEISVKLSEWMGTEVGEFTENPFLYQAACNPDPVLRLTGVNRALEGLAIDVFNTMREFGDVAGDPERRARALEFQRVVDKLFSFGGTRGDDEDSPLRLARRFRQLAGFTETEVDEIADLSRQARDEAAAGAGQR